MLFTFTSLGDAIDHIVIRVEQQGGNASLYDISEFVENHAQEVGSPTIIDLHPGNLADQLEPHAHTAGKVLIDIFTGNMSLIDADKQEILNIHLPELQELRTAMLAQWDAWGIGVDPKRVRFTAPFKAHSIIQERAA